MRMTINELIEKLQAIKIIRGNLEVIIENENGYIIDIADVYNDGHLAVIEEKRERN